VQAWGLRWNYPARPLFVDEVVLSVELFSVQFFAKHEIEHDEDKNCYRAYNLDTIEKIIQIHGIFCLSISLYTTQLYK
jgi:hypothetical protein